MDAQEQTKLAHTMVLNALKFVNDDELWRNFGYKKQPKYGSLFQKFRKKWKVKLERNLLRELIYIHISYSFKSMSFEDSDELDLILNLATSTMTRDKYRTGLWKTFNFDSESEFFKYTKNSIESYIKIDDSEIKDRFFVQLDIGKLPNEKKKAEIIKGITLIHYLFKSHLKWANKNELN